MLDLIMYGILAMVGIYAYIKNIRTVYNVIPFSLLIHKKYVLFTTISSLYFTVFIYIYYFILLFNYNPIINTILNTGSCTASVFIYKYTIYRMFDKYILVNLINDVVTGDWKTADIIKDVNFIVEDNIVECTVCLNEKNKCSIMKDGKKICTCNVNICKECVFALLKNNVYSCVYCQKKSDLSKYFDSDEYCQSVYLNFNDFHIRKQFLVDAEIEVEYNFVSNKTYKEHKVYVNKETGFLRSKYNTSLIEVNGVVSNEVESNGVVNDSVVNDDVVNDSVVNDGSNGVVNDGLVNKKTSTIIKISSDYSLIGTKDEYFILYEKKKCKIELLITDGHSLLFQFNNWGHFIKIFYTKVSGELKEFCCNYHETNRILPIAPETEEILHLLPTINCYKLEA
jgi:hypothetical protein